MELNIIQLLIICFMAWTVFYGLYMAIRDRNVSLFGRTWFQVLYVLQYYCAISYFSHNHFYENIICNKNLKKYKTVIIGENSEELFDDIKYNNLSLLPLLKQNQVENYLNKSKKGCSSRRKK